MNPDPLLAAVSRGVTIHDLGRELRPGMPQSPNHPIYTHSLPRRHGDMVRSDGGSAANDHISMGTHVGTHIDALSHVSQDGRLFNGLDAADASKGGRFAELGVHTIEPMVCRGLLLDIPALLGVQRCEPGYEITPTDLDNSLDRQGLAPEPGDVILIRSGWAQLFDSGAPYVGGESGVPGVSETGAKWLAEYSPRAVGADTIAFERLAPGAGHATLPAHRVLLVEHGIPIIETMNLEGLAAAGVGAFTFVLAPLPLFGATGSPVRPLAVVGS